MALVITACAGFVTAGGALYSSRGKVRIDRSAADTVDRKALAEAVETVQEVYGKLTGDLRTQVDDLIERDRECRSELAQVRADNHQMRVTLAAHSQDIENVKVKLKEPE